MNKFNRREKLILFCLKVNAILIKELGGILYFDQNLQEILEEWDDNLCKYVLDKIKISSDRNFNVFCIKNMLCDQCSLSRSCVSNIQRMKSKKYSEIVSIEQIRIMWDKFKKEYL